MQDGAPITEGYHTGFEREYSDKTLEGVIAFANSDGGTLYIGVDDDGTVIGLEDLDEAIGAAATGIYDNIRPDIMPFVSVEGTMIDDKDVVEIRVHEGMNKPYFLKSKGPREGGVFIRRGPSSIPASGPYICRMIRDEPNETYESSLSIRQNLTFEEIVRIFAERGTGFGQSQMSSMGLMDGQMYTNLAFILSDQFDQDFRMALYEDDYKDSFVDRMESTGSVLRQFEDAYRFVDRYNRRSSRIVGKYREDRRDYLEEVVREALINAVAHRDYSLRGSTLVSMFEDRLEITSMGGLYRNIGLDDIMLRVSSRRNERLASVLNRLDLMETYGTGIPRMMRHYAREPVKPRIETSTNAFKIIVPRMRHEEISEEAMSVLDRFRGAESFRRSDVEESLGISRSKAFALVDELESKGALERLGSGRGTAYRVIGGERCGRTVKNEKER